MLYYIKKTAYREGGFIILEEDGFINQQRGLDLITPPSLKVGGDFTSNPNLL